MAETRLTIETTPGVPVLRVDGDVDFAEKDVFTERLAALPSDTPSVAVDLTGCHYFDSSALGALALFARDRQQQQVVLVAPDPHAKRLFAMAGFDRLFTIVDALERIDRSA